MTELKKLLAIVAFAAASIAFSATAGAQEKGVVINGVRWATRNVDAPGTFASSPEKPGRYYQWNRPRARQEVDSEVTGWWKEGATGDVWSATTDPSPDGWRVPRLSEIATLLELDRVSRQWTSLNGVKGYKFTDKATGASIFLPAAGYRDYDAGSLYYVGLNGYYWSSTGDGSYDAYSLYFDSGSAYLGNSGRRYGLSVRPVAE